jgi:nucleoside 2-deoxyribosyltransferase
MFFMNRLKGQRVYLAGPIDRCPDQGNTWRDTLIPFLKEKGLIVFNPIAKPINVGREDPEARNYRKNLKEMENYDQLSLLMKEIRNVDLRMVDISDFLIVNLDLDIHPCGTLEEIFLANREKKPILIRMEQGKKQCPDWLFGTVPHRMIFSTWEEIKEYLTYIDTSNQIETFKRWYFFSI